VLFLKKRDNTNSITKMKNNTFAIDAALAAIPPKPNTAAIMAMIKNPADQRNIKYDLKF
jgi:hypothetical protein